MRRNGRNVPPLGWDPGARGGVRGWYGRTLVEVVPDAGTDWYGVFVTPSQGRRVRETAATTLDAAILAAERVARAYAPRTRAQERASRLMHDEDPLLNPVRPRVRANRNVRTYSDAELVKLAKQVARKLDATPTFTAEERRLDALADILAREARRRGLRAVLDALGGDWEGGPEAAPAAPPAPRKRASPKPKAASAPASAIETRAGKFYIRGTDKWFGTAAKAADYCAKHGLRANGRVRRNLSRFSTYRVTAWGV